MTDDAMAYRRNQTLRRCPFGDRRRPQADPTLPSPDEQESGTVGVGGLLGVLAVAVLVSAGPVRAEGSEDEQAPSPQIVEVVPGPSRMESSVTSSAVTLVDSDEGKAAKVRVSSSADDGNDETVTGAATRARTTTLSDDATLGDLYAHRREAVPDVRRRNDLLHRVRRLHGRADHRHRHHEWQQRYVKDRRKNLERRHAHQQVPAVTLTTMIAPSHDWFVGVSGLPLLDSEGRRLASREVDLFPWDAGTEDGDDFSLSPSVATNPQGVIASISGTRSFSAKPIATLTFTLQSLSPSFPATESGARAVPENTAAGVDFGEPFVATDPDSGDSVSYSLGGPDAASFAIDATTGQMRTEAALDHEAKSEYSVTVIATDSLGLSGEIVVTIDVINVDEDGTVTLFPTQPRVGTVLRARVDDPDGGVVDEYGQPVEWQWAFSSNKVSWTAVSDMPDRWAGVDYAPDGDKEGMYLRATATYTDAQGSGKTAEVVSDHPVGEPAPAPELSVLELVSRLSHPWDIAFTPDGTMLFTERWGVLSSRLTDGTIQTVTADFSDLWVDVKTGLMGIVTDPDFASNRRFYTCQGHWDVAVQVVSWTIDDGYTTATRVDDPLVYWEISNFGAGLAGCRVRFGPQGYLWISTGDGGVQTNAQDLGSLAGKILRVDASTGAGAPTNPFAPSPVYTYGHRNPQGLALRPGANQMWSVEHGPHWDDEINLLVAGGNYGWDPASSGLDGPMTDLERYPDAIEAKWSSGNPTPATSDGAFLEGEDWGEWEGRLAVATLKMKSLRIFEFTQEGDFVSHVISPEPNWVWGRLRSPVMGPDGALYVTTDRSDLGLGRDRILRVTASRAPAFMTDTQVRDAEENNSPLSIVAKVLALDPKGATLTYTLSGPDAASFNIPDPTVGELRANAAMDYETRRSYEVIVTATNPDGLSDSVTLTINVTDVNEADQSPPSGGGDAGGGGSSGGGGGGGSSGGGGGGSSGSSSSGGSSGSSSSGGSSGGGGGGGADGGGEPPRASELFDDVVAGAWYESAVSWMILHQVTAGCTPTMFCPESNLTRQQFVTFLWRAAGRPTPTYRGSEAFTDVPDGVYADQAIGWAVSNGTTLGCTQGRFGDPDWRFCPTQDVTRGQMATLLY